MSRYHSEELRKGVFSTMAGLQERKSRKQTLTELGYEALNILNKARLMQGKGDWPGAVDTLYVVKDLIAQAADLAETFAGVRFEKVRNALDAAYKPIARLDANLGAVDTQKEMKEVRSAGAVFEQCAQAVLNFAESLRNDQFDKEFNEDALMKGVVVKDSPEDKVQEIARDIEDLLKGAHDSASMHDWHDAKGKLEEAAHTFERAFDFITQKSKIPVEALREQIRTVFATLDENYTKSLGKDIEHVSEHITNTLNIMDGSLDHLWEMSHQLSGAPVVTELKERLSCVGIGKVIKTPKGLFRKENNGRWKKIKKEE